MGTPQRKPSPFWALVLLAGLAGNAAGGTVALAELARPGRVLMLRHALAPGTGDPPEFRLDDCTTQRNLDDSGRSQARRLGHRLTDAGITTATIYSSQWCRCLETASLLQLGPFTELPALNSFYAHAAQRDPQVAALRSFLARLPVDGPPVILVTHQFVINVFTARDTPSAGGSIFQLNGSGEPTWLGTIPPDWRD